MSRVKLTNARRKQRVRLSLRRSGGGRPRLSVFRSSKHIYAQVIDDLKGETLASASSLEKALRERGNTGANIDAAKAVGKLLAERAVKNLPRVNNGLGISVLSTPKGIMADHDARDANVGGEILFTVF